MPNIKPHSLNSKSTFNHDARNPQPFCFTFWLSYAVWKLQIHLVAFKYDVRFNDVGFVDAFVYNGIYLRCDLYSVDRQINVKISYNGRFPSTYFVLHS